MVKAFLSRREKSCLRLFREVFLLGYFLSLSMNLSAQGKLFSFIQITDTHLASDSSTTYPHADSRFNHLVDFLNSDSIKNNVDFILFSGDVVHASPYSLPTLSSDLAYAGAALSRLEIPYYMLIGNHENNWDEGNADREYIFDAFSGHDPSYTFVYKNYLFVMLDCTSGYLYNKNITDRRNRWLQNILDANTDKRIILVTHISPVKMRLNAPVWSYVSINDDLNKIISENANIDMVLSGHVHLNSRIIQNNVNYICTSALASFPFEYHVYDVFEDSITVRTYATPETGISIWTDSTDADHPDDHIYAKGNESERNFSITLCSQPPIVTSPVYLVQGRTADPLNAYGENLRWYGSTDDITGSSFAPVPPTDHTDTIDYYVTQTIGFKCESRRRKVEVIVLGKSLIEGIDIIPNPATDNTTLYSMYENITGKVCVYSFDGKLLREFEIKDQKVVSLDMSSLPVGIYLLKIDCNDSVILKKIIKVQKTGAK